MVRLLTDLDVKAKRIPTGGNCYSVQIELGNFTTLELTDAPAEVWSWDIYHQGEHVIGGDWGTADDAETARKVKAMLDAMGHIAA